MWEITADESQLHPTAQESPPTAVTGTRQPDLGAAHLARPWLGLARPFVDPPAHAVILSVDEKSQIQDLDRTQPGLPLK